MHAGCTMLLGLQTILLGNMCRHGRQSGAQGKEPSRPWGPWPWRSRILLVFHRAQPTTASHLSESSPLTSPPWPDNCILPRKLGSWTLGVTPSQAALESIAFNRHQDFFFFPQDLGLCRPIPCGPLDLSLPFDHRTPLISTHFQPMDASK